MVVQFRGVFKMTNEKEAGSLENFGIEKTVKCIHDACIILKCSLITRAKALLMYHRFRRCVHDTTYDPYMIAAACISLSIKYNEEPIKTDAVILIFFRMLDQGFYQSTQSEKFKEIRKSLILIQCFILRTLCFSLNQVVAHEYVTYFMYDLQEEASAFCAWHVFSERCMRLSSDFYLSKKCLNYKPEEVAAAIVQVSLFLLGIPVNDKGSDLKRRLKILYDCPESKLHSIIEDVFIISNVGLSADGSKLMTGFKEKLMDAVDISK